MDYRLQMALKLLESSDLPVTEVAMRTGFGSSSYFSKIFRRTYGKTPAQHRKGYLALQTEQNAFL